MRTRFLADFFSSSASSQSLQTLDFLRFPPPQLHSPGILSFDDLCCFDQVSYPRILPEIERFSVNEALNKFLSDVFPQRINVEIDQQAVKDVTPEIAYAIFCDEKDLDNQQHYCYKTRDTNLTRGKSINNLDRVHDTNFAIVQFETPELHIVLEDACFLHEEKMQMFFEVKGVEVSPDLPNFTVGEQQLIEVHKSVFSIEDLSMEYQEEHKSDFFEDDNSVQGQISSELRTFPLLEVDETSLGINYISENKHIIFESIEPQPWMRKDELMCDAKELLLSMEFDVFEHLLSHCSLPCVKVEVMGADFVSQVDIINAIEHAVANDKQDCHSNLADGCSSLTSSPLAFEEFQFFNIKTSHHSEVFSDTKNISEVESCEGLFGSTTLSTFNDLIVAHELTLRDDSFKSLPVPIISDHEKRRSAQLTYEEILSKLKLQPSSTSDSIYLDWHLLEEDICSQNICTSVKMFEEIYRYEFIADMNSCDSGMLVLEFVFSDTCPNAQTATENIEVLNLQINAPSCGILMDPIRQDGVASKLKGKCHKRVSEEALHNNNATRNPQFVESMSQFNDLDFFLNPLEDTHVKKQKPADKRLEMDYAFPVVSSEGSIDAHGTREIKWQNLDMVLPKGDIHPTSLLNRSKNSEVLHSIPVEEKNRMESESLEATCEVMINSVPRAVPRLPSVVELKKISTTASSFPDAIVVVNTQNVDTEMIISRRSTYQRILAMEKEGVQIVERDLNLPVDVIVSAAVCLVWYDSTNIRRKTSSQDSASSLLPSCVENIAANVLTSLSFAFSSCILIFEGEISFLAGIMELSDELYAAAASLGIDLQLFCSYSSDTTDEIILNCIAHAAKSTRGLYPKMPESETLAESFLTKFPSVHPLSAHAILSSVGTLIEFLERSHQQRVCAVQKYLVPDVSVTLFSALCRYGEREDSRSGMTDCCSSVSSGHNSGSCYPKSDYEQKKRKYIGSPDTRSMPMDDLFRFEKNDSTWNPPKTVSSQMYRNSEGEEISDSVGKSEIAFDDSFFGENQGSDPIIIPNPLSLSKPINIHMSKIPEISGETMLPNVPVTETLYGQSKRVQMPIGNKLCSHIYNNSRTLQDGFKGEVIDIDDDGAFACLNFSFPHSVGFSSNMENESALGICGSTRNLSSGRCSLPSFPTAAEITSGLDSWIPTKDNGHSSREGINLNSNTKLINSSTPLEHQQMSSEECSANFYEQSFQEKDSHYGRTPLSKAIFSAQPQKGSPWTMEFLNRIKEKSRLRQQSVPCISSAPCFGYLGNSSKFRKTKSPSILEFYRYQRSSTPTHNLENKRLKLPTQPSTSSKAVKTSPPSSRTWTPIDKRAKRRLTFAMNGSKGQSKLIWSDKTDQTLTRRS